MQKLSLLWCALLSAWVLFDWWDGRVRYESGSDLLPFAKSIRVDGWVYLSGQIGVTQDQDGNFHLTPGGLEAESKKSFQTIEESLKAHGLTKRHIVKCTIMLAEMKSWSAFNRLYLEWLDGHKPTRSAFGVSGLALDAALELECWAHR